MKQNTVKWNKLELEVIKIADKELLKHFPEKMNDGKKYTVIRVTKKGNIYWVVYTLLFEGGIDKEVIIKVDITSKKVIEYSPHVE